MYENSTLSKKVTGPPPHGPDLNRTGMGGGQSDPIHNKTVQPLVPKFLTKNKKQKTKQGKQTSKKQMKTRFITSIIISSDVMEIAVL